MSILIEYLAFLSMQAIHADRLLERLVDLPDLVPQPKRKRQFALNRLFLVSLYAGAPQPPEVYPLGGIRFRER